MGRATLPVMIGCLWGWMGGIAEAQCWYPPSVHHCCVVHPIYIPPCLPALQPCCPSHHHIAWKPSCPCGESHASGCCPHSTHKIPCSGADGYFGCHGVIYIEAKRGIVLFNVGGTMRLDVLVHQKSSAHYDHYVESFGRGEWAIAKVPYCRKFAVYFRSAVTEPWAHKHHLDDARHECVSPSINSQLFQQLLNARLNPESDSPTALVKSQIVESIAAPSPDGGERVSDSESPLIVEADALDESLFRSARPVFQPNRNRIIVNSGYVTASVVAKRFPASEAKPHPAPQIAVTRHP